MCHFLAILVLLNDKRGNAYFAGARSRDFLSFYVSTVAVVSGYFMQHDRQPRKVDVFPFLIILHFCCFYACIFSCSNYTNVTYLF